MELSTASIARLLRELKDLQATPIDGVKVGRGL